MSVDCRFDGISFLHLLYKPFLIGSVGLLRGNPKSSSLFVTGLLEFKGSSTFERHNRKSTGSVSHKAPLLVIAIVISIDDQLFQVKKLSAAVKGEIMVGCQHDFVDLVWVWIEGLLVLLALLHLLTAPALLLKSWLILLCWLVPSELILLCLRLLPYIFSDDFLSGPVVLLIGLSPALLILLSLLSPAHKICLLDIIIENGKYCWLKGYEKNIETVNLLNPLKKRILILFLFLMFDFFTRWFCFESANKQVMIFLVTRELIKTNLCMTYYRDIGSALYFLVVFDNPFFRLFVKQH